VSTFRKTVQKLEIAKCNTAVRQPRKDVLN
jgi:hypothetical protein